MIINYAKSIKYVEVVIILKILRKTNRKKLRININAKFAYYMKYSDFLSLKIILNIYIYICLFHFN